MNAAWVSPPKLVPGSVSSTQTTGQPSNILKPAVFKTPSKIFSSTRRRAVLLNDGETKSKTNNPSTLQKAPIGSTAAIQVRVPLPSQERLFEIHNQSQVRPTQIRFPPVREKKIVPSIETPTKANIARRERPATSDPGARGSESVLDDVSDFSTAHEQDGDWEPTPKESGQSDSDGETRRSRITGSSSAGRPLTDLGKCLPNPGASQDQFPRFLQENRSEGLKNDFKSPLFSVHIPDIPRQESKKDDVIELSASEFFDQRTAVLRKEMQEKKNQMLVIKKKMRDIKGKNPIRPWEDKQQDPSDLIRKRESERTESINEPETNRQSKRPKYAPQEDRSPKRQVDTADVLKELNNQEMSLNQCKRSNDERSLREGEQKNPSKSLGSDVRPKALQPEKPSKFHNQRSKSRQHRVDFGNQNRREQNNTQQKPWCRREVEIPAPTRGECKCSCLPAYFTQLAGREPSIVSFPGGKAEFLAHVGQISDCPGHSKALIDSCCSILAREKNFTTVIAIAQKS